MPAIEVQHYIQRAKDFSVGMQELRHNPSNRSSSALLAIHSSISYTDALRTGLGDQSLSSESHQKAAAGLERLLSGRRSFDLNGISHLQYLVSKKNLVSYGDERLNESTFENIITKAERFAKWANKVGSELNLQGWQND